jgi:hypothetical protein
MEIGPVHGIALLLMLFAGVGAGMGMGSCPGTCAAACTSLSPSQAQGTVAPHPSDPAVTGSLHEWSSLFPLPTLIWVLGGGAPLLAEGPPDGVPWMR